MIDAKENLILIDGQIKTAEIESCCYQQRSNEFAVQFVKSTKVYRYGARRLMWLINPIRLSPDDCKVQNESQAFSDISTISEFHGGAHKYWYIIFKNGYAHTYSDYELQVMKSCLADARSRGIFDYLKRVASENSLKTEEGAKLLLKQYEKVQHLSEQSAIAVYLNPEKAKCGQREAGNLIFPFRFNASQLEAVKSAFGNQISVIQGPPGTGKTQTILSIIANILVRGKTVQVVSSNNSAIENILEKLTEEGLDYIVAPLGKSENKQKFIESQGIGSQYPSNINSWHNEEYDNAEKLLEIQREVAELGNLFAKRERLSEARQELSSIKLEREHYKEECDADEIDAGRRIKSTRLIRLLNGCKHFAETAAAMNRGNLSWKIIRMVLNIKIRLLCGISDKTFFKQAPAKIISDLELLFYKIRQAELHDEITNLESYLKSVNADECTAEVCDKSMKFLKNKLYHSYEKNGSRTTFTLEDFKTKYKQFLKDYPVVLSTTFSSVSSLNKNAHFDYLIMDEASQVSIETGALALSCADNAIIVGDSMQLPNVVKREDKERLEQITKDLHVPAGYDCANYSFLESLQKVLPNVANTMLREHYRCHPKIINFCNQRFYGGKLLIMSQDKDEPNVLTAIKTVKGNHSREHENQREIDTIKNELLPKIKPKMGNIGIIAPYNNQVNAIRANLGDGIEVATVHKFQGREKDVVIMSTVDDYFSAANSLSSDPKLLNVSISRAKRKFCLVTTGNKQQNSNIISDLISYIEYNNCEVTDSKIHSIFDYLYRQYDKERKDYLKRHKRVSEYDSENLTYSLIMDITQNNPSYQYLGVVVHQQLNHLINDFSLLDEEERKYASNDWTHLDFLIFNKVSKQPVLAIETDGYAFHKSGKKQAERDVKKDHILEKYGIPLLRLSTTGSGEQEKLEFKLKEILES
jgi:superfamily II DNA or RNA helicase